MIISKRRAIAYIAGRLINKHELESIFDCQTSSHHFFSGTVSKDINIFDFSRSNHLTGTGNSIFDFETRQHITFDLKGHEFSGFDFETRFHFSGTVNNKNISFYDYQDGKFYNFMI